MKEEKKHEPEIIIDENGMPMIVIPPDKIQMMKFHVVGFPPRKFNKLQGKKERDFFEQVLKDLEDIFKGWL